MSDALVTVGVGVLTIGGSLFFLVSAVAMLRSRDAISRVNSLSPATGMGLPMIIAGILLHDTWAHGWSTTDAVKAALAVVASLVVSSVGSNMLGRAAYRSLDSFDPTMRSNALEAPPESGDPSGR